MAQGKVTVNNKTLGQGSAPAIERKALFIGIGATNVGEVLSVNTQSDLDVLLGAADSDIKTNVIAARANGGDAWQAYVAPIGAGDAWADALDLAMQTVTPELVCVCVPSVAPAELDAAYAKAELIRTSMARRVIMLMATPGIDADTQTWAAYATAQAAITNGVNGYRVAVVPQLHGNNLGVLAGRLCNVAASIADSPMRVQTGPLIGLGPVPVDSTGAALDDATLATLDANRLSVPQHYPDYPGTFWGDCNLLDAPGGDYPVIEYLRPVDKAARAVRLIAIAKIANRNFNDSTASMAANKTAFGKPLRDMSKSVTVGSEVFPGDIQPPTDDSVTIAWVSNTSVEVYLKVQPYNSPKEIACNLVLDLS